MQNTLGMFRYFLRHSALGGKKEKSSSVAATGWSKGAGLNLTSANTHTRTLAGIHWALSAYDDIALKGFTHLTILDLKLHLLRCIILFNSLGHFVSSTGVKTW